MNKYFTAASRWGRTFLIDFFFFLGHWDQAFLKFTLSATLRAAQGSSSRHLRPPATCAHKHISGKSVRSRAPEKLYLHLAGSRKHGEVSSLHGHELVLFRRSSARSCRRRPAALQGAASEWPLPSSGKNTAVVSLKAGGQ